MTTAPGNARSTAMRTIGQHLDTEHWAKRLLTECLHEATRAYWLRRAKQFEDARPRHGDFVGQATPEQRRQRWHELTEIANACRARAQVSPLDDAIAPEVEAVWREAS